MIPVRFEGVGWDRVHMAVDVASGGHELGVERPARPSRGVASLRGLVAWCTPHGVEDAP